MKKTNAGYGWPLLTAIVAFSFVLVFVACQKDHHPPQNPAKGTLQTQYGECFPNTTHGTFYNGVSAAADSNYVELHVDVFSPGSYNITTDKVNGVSFSAAGNFTDTGMQTVRLRGTGSFISPIVSAFPVKFDSSTCLFYIYVQDTAALSMADNTWQFTVGSHFYQGSCTGMFYDIPQDPGYIFQFDGQTASGDGILAMSFVTPGDPDTLSHPSDAGGMVNGWYFHGPGPNQPIYYADASAKPAVIDMHVRSMTTVLTPSFKSITYGTFNGTARDSANNIVTVTNAKFKVVN